MNSILFYSLKGEFHQYRGIQAWTRNLFGIENLEPFSSHPYGNHINLGLHQHYSCSGVSAIPECRASERPCSPWNRWLTLNGTRCITRGLHVPTHPSPRTLSARTFHSFSASPFSSTSSTLPSSLFIWSLKPWNCSLHPPFFQSPLKFIGFSGGLPVLLPRGNRDQSIHYFDRDGCRSLCTVPITRTSKGGSPLFSAWPPIQDSPLSPHYAAPL